MTAEPVRKRTADPIAVGPSPGRTRPVQFYAAAEQKKREEARVAHFVIMGCGRVGATLAHTLEDAGHSVAIIDQDDRAFRRLRQGFTGRKVTGRSEERR